MEWTSSDHPEDQNTNLNGSPKVQADGKLIKPPDENAVAIQTGPEMDSDEYPMNRKYRGKALVFSHPFEDNPKLIRKGNKADEERIEKELKELSFDVKIHQDKKVKEIKAILKSTSKEDHSQNDCLVVVVMSHGDESKRLLRGTTYRIDAKDDSYDENMLFDYFDGNSCPTLHGKPKIFFIQACRGDREQSVTPLLAHRAQTDSEVKNESYYYLPNDADFFIFRSAFNGTVSFRYFTTGSVFIQAVCDMLSKNRERKYSRDFMTLMTFAIRRVATQNAQQPNISSTLLRLLYLRPKDDVSC